MAGDDRDGLNCQLDPNWRKIALSLIDQWSKRVKAWLRKRSAKQQGRSQDFSQLLQLRVLRLGLFQDGDVGPVFIAPSLYYTASQTLAL
jgi:hypothetical protein